MLCGSNFVATAFEEKAHSLRAVCLCLPGPQQRLYRDQNNAGGRAMACRDRCDLWQVFVMLFVTIIPNFSILAVCRVSARLFMHSCHPCRYLRWKQLPNSTSVMLTPLIIRAMGNLRQGRQAGLCGCACADTIHKELDCCEAKATLQAYRHRPQHASQHRQLSSQRRTSIPIPFDLCRRKIWCRVALWKNGPANRTTGFNIQAPRPARA